MTNVPFSIILLAAAAVLILLGTAQRVLIGCGLPTQPPSFCWGC